MCSTRCGAIEAPPEPLPDVTADLFAHLRHQHIYRAIESLADRGTPVDLVTLVPFDERPNVRLEVWGDHAPLAFAIAARAAAM